MGKQVKDYFKEKVNFKVSNTRALKYIEKFITSNIDALTNKSYSSSVVFGANKKYDLLQIYDFDERDFNKYVNDHKYLSDVTKHSVEDDPMNIILLLSVLTSSAQRDKDKFLNFIFIKFYSSVYNKYFKYGVNEERMDYVIENLSNRYDIKKYGTLIKVFEKKVETFKNNFKEELERMDDKDLFDNGLITSISTRVNLMVRPLAENEYYPSENMMWKDEEIRERENKRTTTNKSLQFDNLKSSLIDSMVNYRLNNNVLREINGMRYRNDFQDIFENDISMMTDLVSMIIDDFIINSDGMGVEEAKRYGFARYYKNSRKKNPEIPKIINTLVEEYNTANKTEFKKLLSNYMVVIIHRGLQKI